MYYCGIPYIFKNELNYRPSKMFSLIDNISQKLKLDIIRNKYLYTSYMKRDPSE